MALVQIDQWRVERRSPIQRLGRWIEASPLWRFERLWRRPVGISLAVALHLGLVLWLLARLDVIEIEPTPAIAAIKMVDLATGSSEPEPGPDTEQSEPLPPAPPEVRRTDAPSAVAPREWTVTRMRIARISVQAGAASAQAATSAPASGGGGGIYDPYAGASPQRRQNADTIATAVDWEGADSRIDRTAFEAWLAELRKRLPRSRGKVGLEVELGDGGIVEKARLVGGNATPQVALFVRQSVIGHRFALGGTGKIALPIIDLG